MAKEKEVNLEEKKVTLSQIKEDLRSGLTKWKKDDIGFGSIEKKYNLLLQEAVELFSHPKIKNIETRIPTFIIIDDIEDDPFYDTETKIEVKTPEVIVKKEQFKEKIQAFI